MSSLYQSRGPGSEALFAALPQSPHPFASPSGSIDPDDLHLALYCCYELHYRGFEGVDDRWEWEPSLLAFRGELERRFEAELLELVGPPGEPPAPEEIDVALRELMLADDAPSVSTFVEREATAAQALEFMIHRSAYQLKEADPHSWALPRLWGRPKAAMVEIQADEYGAGRADDIHAELFARSMEAVGLDPTYGAYLDQIPSVTLATVNLMSMCGLHRRLRGAIVGHLALFEMTSSVPNRRYASGLRRLGYDGDACLFFDVHVVADAVHENIAVYDMAQGLAVAEPELAADILFGVRALLHLDGRVATHVMESWDRDESSLLEQVASAR